MKKLSLLIAGLILICGQSYGATKVCALGGVPQGIVYDSNDWTCTLVEKPSAADSWIEGSYIKGKANSFPVEFYFFFSGCMGRNPSLTTQLIDPIPEIKAMLQNQAQKTNTIFHDFRQKTANNTLLVYDGAYFDNISSGFYTFFVLRPLNDRSYVMYIKIPSGLLDEQTRENLCNKAFALITPLVS